MQATPSPLFSALLWPLTVWASLAHLNDHAADDYVVRTSPIVATAVAFAVAVAAAIMVQLWSSGGVLIEGLDGDVVRRTRSSDMPGVLWFFVPVIYLIGLWLYTLREEAYPR